MKNYRVIFISLLVVLTSCNAEKLLNEGNFEDAYKLAIKKFEKNQHDIGAREIAITAFNELNKNNLNRISALEKMPDDVKYEQQYYLYQLLQNRQLQAESVIEDLVPPKNYQPQIDSTKRNAGKVHLANAHTYYDLNSVSNFQKSYYAFHKASRFINLNDNEKSLMFDAKDKGTIKVLLTYKDGASNIPIEAQSVLESIKLSQQNKEWLTYHTNYNTGVFYNYSIVIKPTGYKVSNEKTNKKTFEQKKEEITGYKIKKDSKGKPVLDSKGAVVKIPIKKLYKVKVHQTNKAKTANFYMEVSLIDNELMNTFKTYNLSSNYQFENESATYKGDKKALTKDALRLVNTKEKPFPNTKEMLVHCAQNMRSTFALSINLNAKNFKQ